MIVLIDNYDSFSYNLYQLLGEFDSNIKVIRNDAATTDEVIKLRPNAIVLSPGPGRPLDAGICEELVLQIGATIPILGVCLGHQAIVEAYGGHITYAQELMHGKSSEITIDASCSLFSGMNEKIVVGRYHSLAADANSIPECLTVIGQDFKNEVMAIKHKNFPVFGLQFHPESILTPDGARIIENFLKEAQ